MEALICERLASGAFRDAEELIFDALVGGYAVAQPEERTNDVDGKLSPAKNSEIAVVAGGAWGLVVKPNLAKFLMESPLRGSGLEVERIHDGPRPVEL